MDNDFSLNIFFNQLYSNRKLLIKGIFIIGIVSALSALMMPNYYKSSTIFYAASPDLAKPLPIGDIEKDVRIYGDDNDLDRLFTIANSQEVLQYLIDSLDLYTHYNFDKNKSISKFKVKEKLLKNYKTIKTKYGALHLIVEDKNPEMAARIARNARLKIEYIGQRLVKESQILQIANYKNAILQKQNIADSIATKLSTLKKESGVFESYRQSSDLSTIMQEADNEINDARGKIKVYEKYPNKRDSLVKYLAVESASQNKKDNAKITLQRIAPILPQLRLLEQQQARLSDQLSLDFERLKQLNTSYSMPFTALHLVEEAEIPVQKSRPKRALLTLLFSLIGSALWVTYILVLANTKTIHKLQP